MTQPQQGRQLPSGYWLKRVDELLTERSNAALGERGFTRLRWQLLNSVAEAGALGRERLHSTLAPFAAAAELDALAAGLVEAGLVQAGEAGDTLSLTEAGRAEREHLLQLQQGEQLGCDGPPVVIRVAQSGKQLVPDRVGPRDRLLSRCEQGVQRRVAHGAILQMPARQPGKSRLDALLYALDTGVRGPTLAHEA